MSQVTLRHGQAGTPGAPGAVDAVRPDTGARTARRSAAALLGAAVLIMFSVATVAVLASGVAEPEALLDPGPLVRWGLPLVDAVAHLAAMTTLGGLVLCAVVLRQGSASWQRAATLGTVSAMVWTLAEGLHLVLTHASVLGTGVGGIGYPSLLVQFISGTAVGATLGWAVVVSALVAVVAALSTTSAGAAWAVVVAGLALVPRAGLGHAASASSHEVAVSAMWLHLAGIGLWAGGLAVLVFAVLGTRQGLGTVVNRYSSIAGWGVTMVVLSGAAGAWIRLDHPLDLVSTTWGLLLTVKVLAFIVLVAAGWWHRRATLPLLEREDGGTSWPFWRLVAIEILVMAAVVGVSVALGSSSPPVPEARQAEGAGLASLPAPWFAGLVSQWSVDPLFLLAGGAGAWVYVSWVLRLRHRGDAWPVARTVSWLLGMALLVWMASGGVAVFGRITFSVHMLQHMLLISVLPIFVVLASPVSLALRALPRRTDGTRGARELLLSILHHPWAQFFAHPVVAALHVPVSMAVFYLTPLFELALSSHFVHTVMMLHFFLVGYLFTNIVIGTDPGPRRPFYPLRLVLLLPSMVFHTFFGLFLVSSASALAGDYFAALGTPWADPLTDQQVGGAVSWAMGELPAVLLAVIVATRWAIHDDRTRQRAHRPRPAGAVASVPAAPNPSGAAVASVPVAPNPSGAAVASVPVAPGLQAGVVGSSPAASEPHPAEGPPSPPAPRAEREAPTPSGPTHG